MFDHNMRYLASSRRWRTERRIESDPVGQSYYDVFPEIPERWKESHRRALTGEISSADRELSCALTARDNGGGGKSCHGAVLGGTWAASSFMPRTLQNV
jgi:hypothetical protein